MLENDDVDTSPAVMLSPNAQNFVYVTNARDLTVMLKLHTADRPMASVWVHCTAVVPTGNVAPEVAVHAKVVGGVPPDDTGAANVATADVDAVMTATLAGHVIAGSVTGGGPGAVGGAELPHAVVARARLATNNHRARIRR